MEVTCTETELRSAYKKRALKFHPGEHVLFTAWPHALTDWKTSMQTKALRRNNRLNTNSKRSHVHTKSSKNLEPARSTINMERKV